MTYYIIMTFVPENDIDTVSKRLYHELHQSVDKAKGIDYIVANVAEACEDAAERGYMMLRSETFTDENEFCEAWAKLTNHDEFKRLY